MHGGLTHARNVLKLFPVYNSYKKSRGLPRQRCRLYVYFFFTFRCSYYCLRHMCVCECVCECVRVCIYAVANYSSNRSRCWTHTAKTVTVNMFPLFSQRTHRIVSTIDEWSGHRASEHQENVCMCVCARLCETVERNRIGVSVWMCACLLFRFIVRPLANERMLFTFDHAIHTTECEWVEGIITGVRNLLFRSFYIHSPSPYFCRIRFLWNIRTQSMYMFFHWSSKSIELMRMRYQFMRFECNITLTHFWSIQNSREKIEKLFYKISDAQINS